MTPNEYQRAAMRTAPPKLNLAEAALGMATEASEAADVIKKHLFQGHPLDAEKLKKEMGDALWYMAYVCHIIDGLDLESVMKDNIAKLHARFPNGFTPEASMARVDEKKDIIKLHLERAGLKRKKAIDTEHNSKMCMLRYLFDEIVPLINPLATIIKLSPRFRVKTYKVVISAGIYDPYYNLVGGFKAFAICNTNIDEDEYYWSNPNMSVITRIFPNKKIKEGGKLK
ncbi:MAG: nucleoside triphosphate pyrophosphohydrolase family protein [Selenomonadaceae bacterium]|nr:nucleoside triphosphate pyrophosphohydrolase family protein [Selenomonadaceae bacterium]MBP3723824.1 nucleoside triphosphate pyrophosphohydrolase family protein [Selenomonadaceae bacterium]